MSTYFEEALKTDKYKKLQEYKIEKLLIYNFCPRDFIKDNRTCPEVRKFSCLSIYCYDCWFTKVNKEYLTFLELAKQMDECKNILKYVEENSFMFFTCPGVFIQGAPSIKYCDYTNYNDCTKCWNQIKRGVD